MRLRLDKIYCGLKNKIKGDNREIYYRFFWCVPLILYLFAYQIVSFIINFHHNIKCMLEILFVKNGHFKKDTICLNESLVLQGIFYNNRLLYLKCLFYLVHFNQTSSKWKCFS